MKILTAGLLIGLTMSMTPAMPVAAEAHEGTVGSVDETVTARAYTAAMCTLTGDWTGQFEQYNETGLYRTSQFDAGFRCQPGDDVLMETNLFYQDDGSVLPTLKVIFPTEQPAEMQMSYFYGGIERVYFFKAATLDYTDDEHWTSARESTETTHESDENPPVSRYIHIRSGDQVTMIREVKPDRASKDWSLSAKLVLKLQP